MNDLTFLFEYVDLVILGICLCVGYVLKHAKVFEKIGNDYIPAIVLMLGTLISIITHWGNVNTTVILGGMISGLASTGLHEMLRNLLNYDGKKIKL